MADISVCEMYTNVFWKGLCKYLSIGARTLFAQMVAVIWPSRKQKLICYRTSQNKSFHVNEKSSKNMVNCPFSLLSQSFPGNNLTAVKHLIRKTRANFGLRSWWYTFSVSLSIRQFCVCIKELLAETLAFGLVLCAFSSKFDQYVASLARLHQLRFNVRKCIRATKCI